jgi:hypothetical protein
VVALLAPRLVSTNTHALHHMFRTFAETYDMSVADHRTDGTVGPSVGPNGCLPHRFAQPVGEPEDASGVRVLRTTHPQSDRRLGRL